MVYMIITVMTAALHLSLFVNIEETAIFYKTRGLFSVSMLRHVSVFDKGLIM